MWNQIWAIFPRPIANPVERRISRLNPHGKKARNDNAARTTSSAEAVCGARSVKPFWGIQGSGQLETKQHRRYKTSANHNYTVTKIVEPYLQPQFSLRSTSYSESSNLFARTTINATSLILGWDCRCTHSNFKGREGRLRGATLKSIKFATSSVKDHHKD